MPLTEIGIVDNTDIQERIIEMIGWPSDEAVVAFILNLKQKIP